MCKNKLAILFSDLCAPGLFLPEELFFSAWITVQKMLPSCAVSVAIQAKAAIPDRW